MVCDIEYDYIIKIWRIIIMKKRLALIGCGGIGQYHLSHFVQFKDIVDLVGLCDLIPELS